ncbi:MAG: class I SAM-dependent methyltransferase [Desulfobacterales bacterium]|nr:class I SAM-dependent methyltransferase [Desulfobacterales bacterium]
MRKHNHIPFTDSADFLDWWFQTKRLEGKALHVFNRYYANYRMNFSGYLRLAWADRHLELDREFMTVKEKSGLKVLDLGCGTGSVSLYLACKLQCRGQVLAVDIKKDRLFCAVERKRVLERELGSDINCEFRKSNVLSLNDRDKFDLIYLEEALHHMEPRVEVVKKISNILKDNGILIVSESNAYNPLMQLHLFRQRGLTTIKKGIGEDGEEFLYGVERILPPRVVAKLFRKNGLKMKSLRYFRIAPSKLGLLAGKNGVFLMKTEKTVCKIPVISKIFSVHYNIVLQK